MKTIISDIETERLDNPEKLWVFGGKDAKTGEITEFHPWKGKGEVEAARDWAETVDLWVGHNFINFDAIHTNRFIGRGTIPFDRIIDTLVVSRLYQYDVSTPKGCKRGPHSLEAWGLRLGCHKGDFTKFEEWPEYEEEGLEYWRGDLETTEKVFEHFKPIIFDPQWKKSLRVEHDIQYQMEVQKYYGFAYDKKKGEELLVEVNAIKEELEAEIEKDYPPQLLPVNTIKNRVTKEGEPYATVTKAKEKYPVTKVDGDDLICYDYVAFNPGSAPSRIEKLWDAGWQPFEKTKTHQRFLRTKPGDDWRKTKKMTKEFWEEKKAHFDYYGWVVNEDNLKTLPTDAPEGARKLAQWLTLEGRRSSLVEWNNQCGEDGRIHGNVFAIGAWSGRCSHNNPNTASSINAPFKKLLVEANLPKDLRIGDLRKTAITEMVEAGVDQTGILPVSGHKSLASLNPYMKPTLKGATSALERRKKS